MAFDFLKNMLGIGKKVDISKPIKLKDKLLVKGEKVFEYDPIRKSTRLAESIQTRKDEQTIDKEIQQKVNHFYVASINLKSAKNYFERHHNYFYTLVKK